MAPPQRSRSGAAVAAIAALVTAGLAVIAAAPAAAQSGAALEARLDRLEAEIAAAEDLAAVKRLQRAYGYYVDKGMWADLAELFTEDAVANYPAGVFIGKESITRHLFLNVGGGEMGDVGLGDGRLYDHLSIQPVVHLGPGGDTARGRWRVLAMFGRLGGGATWADGVYNVTYAKEDGVWKIRTLDYHSGFSAPYDTGWVAPTEPRQARGPRDLPHPPDRERNMGCEGFPDACIAPFHYANPGTAAGGSAWTADSRPRGRPAERAGEDGLETRAAALAARAERLADAQSIENLIRIYGYYFERRMWDQVAALFADDATIEMAQRGVYVGRARIREFLELLGRQGLSNGQLFDHVQLQPIVTVAADGLTAKARSRTLAMTGVFEQSGEWSAGIHENTFVKEDGVWKLKSLLYYPTFITDYDQGWGRDAKPAPGVSDALPPDRPPTDVHEIYPKAHIPPFHYPNPVTGLAPQYPRGAGRPSEAALAAVLAPVAAERSTFRPQPLDLGALLAEAERTIARVKDYHELENLENAYGYYLDKNLWNDLANLFAREGSMELAQRGVYRGRERVRGFLFAVFGAEGPQPGRLGNHLHMQPVIHVAPYGQSARIRSRMMQQLSFGGRPSMGAAIYENRAVKEDGVWKFGEVHAFNTWTASYDGGWARSPGRRVPGPSESYPPDAPPTFEFEMFPTVYDIPFHYPEPAGIGAPGDGAAAGGASR